MTYRLTAPLARLWVTESAQSWRTLPVPTDAPLTHAPGLNADRLLLIGAGITVSYGVMSYDLGLAGHLARRVSALTERGASIFVRADPNMTVPEATAILASMDVEHFDGVVATLGGLEAMTLFPVKTWRAQLDEFVSACPVPVFIVGVAPISSIIRMPRAFGAIVTAHAQRINAAAAALCASHESATFVPFSPTPGDMVSDANRATYGEWAELVAAPVASILNQRADARTARPPVDEDARQRSLDAMAILDTPDDEELNRIVETVRDLFGTAGAAVNIIDHDRQWVMAAAGLDRDDRARKEALCDETVDRGDVFVLTDESAQANARWAHALAPWKFYAGYPIESPDGHRIGALCIVDTRRRSFDDADRALLRDLALHTQSVLWERQLR